MTKCLITQIPGLTGWSCSELVAWRYAAGRSDYVDCYGGLRIAYFGGGGGWKRKTLEICYVAL